MNLASQALAIGCALAALPCAAATRTVSAYEIVVVESAVNNQAQKQVQANCPAGKRALSAGWGVLDPTSAILEGAVTYFEPSYDGKGWLANAQNRSAFAPEWKLRIRLVCAKAP